MKGTSTSGLSLPSQASTGPANAYPARVAGRTRTPREIALNKPLPDRADWDNEVGPAFFEAWGYPRGEFMPEHFSIYGQTGRGKSHFETYILKERARLRGSRVVIVATKKADKTLVALGWPIITDWPPPAGWRHRKRDYRQVIFWAKADGLGRDAQNRQAAKIRHLLDSLWVPDCNTVVAIDEVSYIEEELNMPPHDLKSVLARYDREARALGITNVKSTQRPVGTGRTMHSESTWSAAFAPKDEDDAERMAQILGNKLYYRRVLSELDATKYEFVLVHNLTGEAVITSLPKKPIPTRLSRPAQESPRKGDRVS